MLHITETVQATMALIRAEISPPEAGRTLSWTRYRQLTSKQSTEGVVTTRKMLATTQWLTMPNPLVFKYQIQQKTKYRLLRILASLQVVAKGHSWSNLRETLGVKMRMMTCRTKVLLNSSWRCSMTTHQLAHLTVKTSFQKPTIIWIRARPNLFRTLKRKYLLID